MSVKCWSKSSLETAHRTGLERYSSWKRGITLAASLSFPPHPHPSLSTHLGDHLQNRSPICPFPATSSASALD